MKKNEGLSLVELIVVIAVAAVMVSVVGISITVVSRQKVSNAASEVRALFQTAQTIAMSKDNCHVDIQRTSNGETVFTIYSSSNTILDKVTVSEKISVSIGAKGSETAVSGHGIVRYYYKRESGSFSKSLEGCTATTDGSETSSFFNSIVFSNGSGSKSVSIQLTKLTGKVSY